MTSHLDRRGFVTSASAFLGGGWLWLNLPALAALAGCTRDASRRGEPFTHLTAEQGRTLRALVARIIPSGEGIPGAEEAGATWFIDAILGGPMADAADLMGAGLADLDERGRTAHGAPFAELTAEQQDELIRGIEDTEFFGATRFFTILGTFSGEAHGGNRDHAGYRLLQLDHASAYQPPFGWYDEQYARTGGGMS